MNLYSASIGFIWLILWIIYGANSPDESKFITIHELTYIQATSEKPNDKVKSIREWPLKSILTSKSVLVIILTNVLSDFTLYGIFSVFPLYFWEIYNIGVVVVCLNVLKFKLNLNYKIVSFNRIHILALVNMHLCGFVVY